METVHVDRTCSEVNNIEDGARLFHRVRRLSIVIFISGVMRRNSAD